jgi:DNA polymerase-1
MSEKKLFLLDGHALVYRAHYAFISRPLINSKGLNTSAIMGFTNVLRDLIKKENPTHLAVSFDLSGPTFRNEIFEDYKANRESQPEEITAAFPYIHEVIKGFKIPIVTCKGYEADDVIGTLAKRAEKEGFKVYMMTPDKDYAQLVSPNIFMYKPARSGNDAEILGVEEILENWGIERVEQVIDILGLQGDAVDNIPGIPGIGPKTAQKLLAAYGSLEGLLENVDKLKGKQKEKVIEFADQGRLSKVLATIDTEVPVEINFEDTLIEEPDRPALGKLFQQLEFRRLSAQMLGEPEDNDQQLGGLFGGPAVSTSQADKPAVEKLFKDIDSIEHDYIKVDELAEMKKLAADLLDQKIICFDTETTSINANDAELVGIAFAYEKGKAYYVPVPSDPKESAAIVDIFRPVLEHSGIAKTAHNYKYDAIVMKRHGVALRGPVRDTLIAHYLLNPDLRHKMDYLAETILNYKPIPIEKLIGKGKNQLSMRDISIDKVVPYASEDADITLQLDDILFTDLEKDGLDKLYKDMEEPLIEVLVQMEYNGVNIDTEVLGLQSKAIEGELINLEKDLYVEAGSPFNILSPKQVGEILFDRLKIPYRWKLSSKSKQYSTSEDKLKELEKEHPIVGKILRFRGLSKLKSTYLDALPKLVSKKTGLIHSSFNQALTTTGRLSSNNPNLQNIPIRTTEGARVREAFVPRESGHVILAADYSQIELRLIAEISKDEGMLDAFINGQDIHSATAAKVFGVAYDQVTKEQRYRAKTVNFSITYGAGATNLAGQLDIPRSEAKKIIESYYEQYPGLKSYMTDIVESARANGYVETLMGRRRYLRNINSGNAFVRSGEERNAINSPIQGSAADMIKLAMIKIHRALIDGEFKTKMIMQVHDELVFDVPQSELEQVSSIIEDCMKNAMPGLKVPILVGMDHGANWLEAH